MKKGIFVALVAVLTLGLVTAGVSAFSLKEDFQGNDAIFEALKDGDYELFMDSMDEDTFNEFRAMEKHSHRHRQRMPVEVMESLDAEDYDAFVEAVESLEHVPPCLEIVTEETFDTFVEMHQALQDHDIDTAKELADELGLEKPGFLKPRHAPEN